MKFLTTLLSKYKTKVNRKKYVTSLSHYTCEDPVGLACLSVEVYPDTTGKIHITCYPEGIIGSLSINISYVESSEASYLNVVEVSAYNYYTDTAVMVTPHLPTTILASDEALTVLLKRIIEVFKDELKYKPSITTGDLPSITHLSGIPFK